MTVVLLCGPTVTNAGFAHPACTPSCVITVADDAAAEPSPDGADMAMTAALVEHGGGALLPTLLAELAPGRVPAGPGHVVEQPLHPAG